MIVLDASVLIAYLDRDDSHHVAAESLLAEAVDGDLGVDPLTLAEVLVAPARNDLIEAAKAALRNLEVAELPFPSAVRLARLRSTTGLRMPDCCVLLAAEDAAATAATAATIASFDDRLVHTAEARKVSVFGR